MSYVYVVAHKGQDGPEAPVKIGIASSPHARLSSLQTGSPRRLTLVHLFYMPERRLALLAEQESHSVLNQYTIGGEWFDCDPYWALRITGDVVKWALEEEYEDSAIFQKHFKLCGYDRSRAMLPPLEDGE